MRRADYIYRVQELETAPDNKTKKRQPENLWNMARVCKAVLAVNVAQIGHAFHLAMLCVIPSRDDAAGRKLFTSLLTCYRKPNHLNAGARAVGQGLVADAQVGEITHDTAPPLGLCIFLSLATPLHILE